MAKSRDKIQQFGFWDTEVASPDHDAVCLWAYSNAEAIFRFAYPNEFNRAWEQSDVDFPSYSNSPEVIASSQAFISATPRPDPRIAKRTLEFVLKNYTGYRDNIERIVGYADLLIETSIPRITPTYKSAGRGYDDVLDGFELSWPSDRRAPRILVEAKSVLPTVGELMRQIQLYRTAFGGKIVVASPDDSYSQILAEQDVAFIKYDVARA